MTWGAVFLLGLGTALLALQAAIAAWRDRED